MTTTPAADSPVERRLRIEQHLQAIPAPSKPYVSLLSANRAAAKTGQSVTMVMTQMLAGHDLSDCDDFWIDQATRELEGRVGERERVLQAATKALICRRTRSPKARRLAIAVLTAGGHPAFADPLIASVPIAPTGRKAARA
jgi:hypothetical protein